MQLPTHVILFIVFLINFSEYLVAYFEWVWFKNCWNGKKKNRIN